MLSHVILGIITEENIIISVCVVIVSAYIVSCLTRGHCINAVTETLFSVHDPTVNAGVNVFQRLTSAYCNLSTHFLPKLVLAP